MVNLSPISFIKLKILFNISRGFFQYEALILLSCLICVFDFALDVLIVVYAPRVYLF